MQLTTDLKAKNGFWENWYTFLIYLNKGLLTKPKEAIPAIKFCSYECDEHKKCTSVLFWFDGRNENEN